MFLLVQQRNYVPRRFAKYAFLGRSLPCPLASCRVEHHARQDSRAILRRFSPQISAEMSRLLSCGRASLSGAEASNSLSIFACHSFVPVIPCTAQNTPSRGVATVWAHTATSRSSGLTHAGPRFAFCIVHYMEHFSNGSPDVLAQCRSGWKYTKSYVHPVEAESIHATFVPCLGMHTARVETQSLSNCLAQLVCCLIKL